MAYSPTTLLSLPVISTGTESGAWGDITNNGLTQYLDISIAGALSVTATTTLANTAGTSSTTNIASTTAQYRTIIIPASGPSANIVITAPSSNRAYHVVNRNATYTVQIRAGTNSGVTIGANQSATVAYDSVAADYVLVGPIGPTVPVANGGTGATSLTANNVILGNGASAVQFVAPGSNGNVLTSNGTTWTSASLSGFVTLSGSNAFTGANTFYNATGQTFAPATANDGIIIQGRAGGSSSYRVTFATATLSANRTLTAPDNDGTVLTTGAAVTVPQGGTGLTTTTAYGLIVAGTSATGNFQQVSGTGTASQVLTSNGASALPTWQDAPAPTAQNTTVMVQTTDTNFFPGNLYTWNITNFDSYVTYTTSTTNGSVVYGGGVITYTPSTTGSGGYVINGRTIPLTISTPNGYFNDAASGSNYYVVSATPATDSSNNIYALIYNNTSSPYGIIKFNSSGFQQSTITFNYISAGYGGGPVVVDSSGNIYTASYGSNIASIHTKLDSSGTILWSRSLSYLNTYYYTPNTYAIILDSSNNSYAIGWSSIFSAFSAVTKFDTSGNFQYRTWYFTGGAYQKFVNGALYDSSHLLTCGQYDTTWAVSKLYLSNANYANGVRATMSSGSYSFGGQWLAMAVAKDSSGNVYAALQHAPGGSGNAYAVIAKLNSSLNITYLRLGSSFYSNSNAYAGFYGIAIDSSDNVYLSFYGNPSTGGTPTQGVLKLNSSGVTQWVREFTNLNGQVGNIAINGTKLVVTVGGSSQNVGTMSLPTDGTGTGSYLLNGNTITYVASSYFSSWTTLTGSGTDYYEYSYTQSPATIGGSFSDTASGLTTTSGSYSTSVRNF